VSRQPTLDGAAADHRAEVAAAAAAFAAVPDDAWERPLGDGKWSAAEISQHLVLAFEKLAREIHGGPSVRFMVPAWKRAVFRRLFLGRMLRGNWWPGGVQAPPEARPEPPFPSRADALTRLGESADGFERAIRDAHARRHPGITHPYLGRLAPAVALRFFAFHTRHHRLQLARRLERMRAKGEET